MKIALRVPQFRWPPVNDKNLTGYSAAVSAAVFLFCFAVMKITAPPEGNYLSKLNEAAGSLEERLYGAAARRGLLTRQEIDELAALADDVRALRARADEIWDAIPAGAVVEKRGVGGRHPVGKNIPVRELRKKADEREADLQRKKRSLGVQYGPVLSRKYGEPSWGAHQQIMASIQSVKDAHAWYYGGWVEIAFQIVRALMIIPTAFSGGVAVLSVLLSAFSFFDG